MNEQITTLISEQEISERVDALAAQINADYAGKTIHLVCALKGAAFFAADLARKLHNTEIDFIRTSSYGANIVSSGQVRMEMDMTTDASGKHILLVEDIVDTGYTLAFLQNYIVNTKKAASYKACVLLDKPDRRIEMSAKYDYLGFTIPDKFVVGYGLDFDQRYRNLPYIGVINFLGESNE